MAFGMLEDSLFSAECSDDYFPVIGHFANWCDLSEIACVLSPEHHPGFSTGTVASALLGFYSSVSYSDDD